MRVCAVRCAGDVVLPDMHRTATPLWDDNVRDHRRSNHHGEGADDGDLPLTVLELNQSASPKCECQASVDAAAASFNEDGDDQKRDPAREIPQNESSGAASIRVMTEDGQSMEMQPLPRRKQSDHDTSWAKIKKKTSPVVNASVVLMYLVLSSMFVVGWVSLNSCTLNPLIPVYLIVAGSTGILTKALIRTRNKYLFNVVILLVLFDLCWQAFGSLNVYKEYPPNFDPRRGAAYCHRVAYLLAFWIITIVYALMGLFILLSCCYFMMRNTFRTA